MKKSTNTGSALKTWLKNAFTKNLALKIVSLIFAMLLWGYVLMSENPQRTKTLTNVPISVEGGADLIARKLVLSGDIKIDEADRLKDEVDGELVMVGQVEISKKKNATTKEKTKQTLTVVEGKGYYNITDEKQNILTIPKGTVALSHKVAKDLSVGIGDTIYWHIYTENTWYKAKVGVINRSPDTQGITFLREDFEKTGADFTPGILATNQDASSYKNREYVTNVVTKAELKQAFDTSMEVVDLLLYFMVGFSALMIVLVLYNSGNLSFNERIKEFATLKVMGLQTTQIRNILTIQNIWLTVIGLIIGAPFGKATLEAMMNSNGEQFDYTIRITPQVYLESALLVLVVSMLVSFYFICYCCS